MVGGGAGEGVVVGGLDAFLANAKQTAEEATVAARTTSANHTGHGHTNDHAQQPPAKRVAASATHLGPLQRPAVDAAAEVPVMRAPKVAACLVAAAEAIDAGHATAHSVWLAVEEVAVQRWVGLGFKKAAVFGGSSNRDQQQGGAADDRRQPKRVQVCLDGSLPPFD
jgi:hypothetical protein